MSTIDTIQERAQRKSPDLLQMELLIAQLLRLGVILSFIILAVGLSGVVLTAQTGYDQISLDDLNSIVQYHAGHAPFPNSLGDIALGVLALKPYAIIAFGLVVLIAIPILRVVVSVIAFAWERDRLYVFITAFVLAMLLLSLVIGEVGG